MQFLMYGSQHRRIRQSFNLPVTVELSMPHVYASQIEYMSENMKYRRKCNSFSASTYDRGCGVADSELGLLAGADRVEGTLFETESVQEMWM